MKSDPVCPYCHRPLIEIYYYGEVLPLDGFLRELIESPYGPVDIKSDPGLGSFYLAPSN